ncbi:MAG TPA: hypothetical protein VHP63_01560 [candidate division Zixibacteria bacterium]|nr:hypothetical protein [candidate division Zixibacteria bacterium]
MKESHCEGRFLSSRGNLVVESVNWAVKQCEELLNGNKSLGVDPVPCIHFYVMNGADSVINVIKAL